MQNADLLAAHEAGFWSQTSNDDDRTLFDRIVHQSTTLVEALARCAPLATVAPEARETVYRALGNRLGEDALKIETAPTALIL